MEKKEILKVRIVRHTPFPGQLALERWYKHMIGGEFLVKSVSPLYYTIADNFRPARILKSDCEIITTP